MTSNVSYRILESDEIAVHTVRPGFSSDGILRSIADRLDDPNYAKGMGVVWHMTRGCKVLGLAENSNLHSQAQQLAADWAPYRVAFVGEENLQFGCFRQMVSLGSSRGFHYHVFHDLQSAMDWVKQPIPPQP